MRFKFFVIIAFSSKDVRIFNSDNWQKQHWKSLLSAYKSSPFFEYYENEIEHLFLEKADFLLDFNLKCFKVICDCLQLELITTKTSTYHKTLEDKVDLRHLVNAKKDSNYHFTKYTQVFNSKYGFIENLNIIDLLFNEGPNALNYLESQTIITS